jgi:hypothetical protein
MVELSQYQVINTIEFAETKYHTVIVGYMVLCQLNKQIVETLDIASQCALGRCIAMSRHTLPSHRCLGV